MKDEDLHETIDGSMLDEKSPAKVTKSVSIVSFKPGKSSTKSMGMYEVKNKLLEAKRKNLELSNEYLELKIRKANWKSRFWKTPSRRKKIIKITRKYICYKNKE
jgi:hypothetical protein